MRKKASDIAKYNEYLIGEIEKGVEPYSFFGWYMDTYLGHLIEAAKKKK